MKISRPTLPGRGLPVAFFFALAMALPPSDAYAAALDPRAPVLVVAYYDGPNLPRLVEGLNAAEIPEDTAVYFGNHFGTRPRKRKRRTPKLPPADEVAGERYRYAPIFPVKDSTFRDRRVVAAEEAQILAQQGDDGLAGRMPSLKKILRRSPGSRRRIGRELGRRFRDRIRARRRIGIDIVTWQLDEIVSEVGDRKGRPVRDWTRGILEGLTFGRPELGDVEEQGVVWAANRALALARRAPGGELREFWETLDRAALRLVGEEYPRFVGNPRREARRQSRGQRLLARGGGARSSLASKYVAGVTPGYRLKPGLGGNVRRKPRATVNRWREAYIQQRARSGVAGFGAWNFRFRNRSRAVIGDTLGAVVRGVRASADTRR